MRALVLVGTLAAGWAPLARAEQPPRAEGSSPAAESRREALRVVDAYVVSNLQESLGLTDAEFTRALPLVMNLQSERREYLLARVRLLRQLRRQLRSGTADEAGILQTLGELKKVEGTHPERVRAAAAEVDAVLTPLQQAKFRVLELEVEQRLRELMGRARERGTKERPRRE